MKRFAFIACIAFVATTRVFAVSSTPSATPNKQVEDLKERLATKVAELRQTQKRAFFGSVKAVSLTSMTVATKTKDIKTELLDEAVVVQYLKGTRTKLTTGDIDKGDVVAVFGEYDATVDILKASVIIIQNTVTERVSGTITAISKADYTITIAKPDGASVTIDNETITKINIWDKEKGIQKAGFSKLTVGDTIHVLGTPVVKQENRYSALRILNIGNLTAPATSTSSTTPTPSSATSPATTPTLTPTSKPTSKPTTTPTP